MPRTLAKLRLASYEEYCWLNALGSAFRRQGMVTAVALVAALSAVMLIPAWLVNPDAIWRAHPAGNFYAIVPHSIMAGLFGGVLLFVLSALTIGIVRFWRDAHAAPAAPVHVGAVWRGLRDALTLKHLHSTGTDCTTNEEMPSPWRRRFHHCTSYGFMLCFASTSVAAIFHGVFGWHAPYPLVSAPVLLGTVGGIGLLVGPVGLMVLRRHRDSALTDPDQNGMDESFILLLFLTSLTGLILMVLRDQAVMGLLLIVHLAAVMALFVTVPYGKFVHAFYRIAALIKYAVETESH